MANVTFRWRADGWLIDIGDVHQDRPIDDHRRLFVHAVLMNILNDADHLVPRVAVGLVSMLADRVRRRAPSLTGKTLRHDHLVPQAVIIGPVEVATRNQVNAHGIEVSGRNIVIKPHLRFGDVVVFALHLKLVPVGVDSVQRHRSSEADCSDIGNRRKAIDKIVLNPSHHLFIRHHRRWNRSPHRLHVSWIAEARIHSQQRHEGPDHQRSTDQQHQRHCYLSYDKHIAGTIPRAATAGRATRTRKRIGRLCRRHI